ncbi:MAG: hypothetical protein BGN97_15985 [Microbacterium sp. 69-10]|nr:MAG: hypothetical protein BGN97_15985 [Microbacterium sp. 69-10]
MQIQREIPGSSQGRLLQLLHQNGDRSRADLARAAGFTKATVSSLVTEMLEEGLIVETRRRPIGGRGRPAVDLNIDRENWRVVALDLSHDDGFYGAVLDLSGRVLHRDSILSLAAQGEVALQMAIELAERLCAAAAGRIIGMGVSAPGIVDADGVVLASHNLRWTDVPLKDVLLERFDLPVSVENDANVAALAERDRVGAQSDLMVVKLGYGVGSGIIANGKLIHGSHYTAGEIGHIASGDSADYRCVCGRAGCLEATLSLPRLNARLSAADERDRAEILEDAGRILGNALAPLVGALGTEVVILTGVSDEVADSLVVAARDAMRPRLTEESWASLDLRISPLGDDLAFQGAVSLVSSAVLGVP